MQRQMHKPDAQNEVKILCMESDYLDKNYRDVEKELTEFGFDSI